MTEKLSVSKNIEQFYNETEKTYIPRDPALLDRFLDHTAKSIQQPYLSHPSEQFSLRLRHTGSKKGTKIDTTLKSRGEIVTDGLSRDEFTAPITLSRYGYYRDFDLPAVRKRRSSPLDAIDVDFYADGYRHIESEDPVAWNRFLDEFGFSADDFIDVTGEIFTDNEWRAHQSYRREHGGHEALVPYREFETEIALDSILQYAKSRLQISRARIPVVRIYGRSGSGKSYYLDQLRARLSEQGVPSNVISTDNYNIGITEMTRRNGGEHPTDFEDVAIYNLPAVEKDVMSWLRGDSIRERTFDFETSEPVVRSHLPAPQNGSVLFVEGLWARHSAFDHADLSFEVETPMATCIGRRILRDVVSRPEFSPEANLGYYVEHVEPSYRTQR